MIRNRRSIRLQGYDYSRRGAYFITICTQNRKCLFGNIQHNEICLNDAGRMTEKWYYELENKFPDIQCGTHICMPNHFHCVLFNVGADLRVCPKLNITGACHESSGEHGIILGEHTGSPLRNIVQWFKTMTTNEYIRNVKQNGWCAFPGKLWQRNYYEHIIRNDDELIRIRDYIKNNPLNWSADNVYEEIAIIECSVK